MLYIIGSIATGKLFLQTAALTNKPCVSYEITGDGEM
jgi:hypothetical protein